MDSRRSALTGKWVVTQDFEDLLPFLCSTRSILVSRRGSEPLLQNLTFLGTAAHEDTCKWLLDDSSFLNWLANDTFPAHHGFFWIKGKPAAGKSTIVKFALNSLKKRYPRAIILSFFFHARGGDLEKTSVGMYRSILYQLLTRLPHLQSVLVLCPPKMSDEGIPLWDMETLKTVFRNALEQLGEESLICVIDALDECPEDQVRDMIFFFERLGDLSTSSNIRTFFSSRHYPNITIQHSIVLMLDDHSGHVGDIVKYVNSKLRIPGQPNLTDDLRAEIHNRSSGIFLWVILVIEILKKHIDRGRVHQLKKRLENMPSGLDDLFNDILSRDTENMQDLILCLQWLCFAHQPLNPEQFYHAVLAGSEPGFPSSADPEQINQHNVYNFILDSSKGLAEITKTKAPTVQFIHESVREYLLNAGGLQR